ncbi:MAG: hypothetical protein ABIN35_01620 [candidate division WOR-3 bacterium]
MKKFFYVPLILFLSTLIFPGYFSGDIGYYFLNIPVDPLSQAYSTTSAAIIGRNGDLINPASLYMEKDEKTFSFTYMPFLISSHFGLFTYNFNSSQILLKYFNSGMMERRDSLNNDLGEFFSSDLLIEFSKSFRLNQNLYVGGGLNAGLEKVLDYNNIFSTLNLGLIYERLYFDFLNVGFQILNLGGGYDFEKPSITPLKVVLGFSLGKDEMPFSANMDLGKIVDRKYFYSFALKFSLIRPPLEKKLTQQSNTQHYFEQTTVKDDVVLNDDTSNIFQDSLPSDIFNTSNNDSLLDTLTTDQNKGFESYADFLDEEKKDTLDNLSEKKSVETKENIKISEKKNIFSPLALDLIFGVSSDRNELQLGYATDISAALTAGFKLSYKNVSVLWSSKFWGELGVSQSIGIKMSF